MEHPNRTRTHWLGKGLMSLLAVAALVLAVAAPALAIDLVGYASYDEDTKTLTFAYGALPETPNTWQVNNDDRPWLEFADQIETAVFDESYRENEPVYLNEYFKGCTALKIVSGSQNVNTKYVVFIESMFEGCTSLKTLDLSTWSTEDLGIAENMFKGCTSLETLNIAAMNTTGAGNLRDMFEGCDSLKSVTLGNKFDFHKHLMPTENINLGSDCILPTPATEYGTWWRGSGKAYTPEEMLELTGEDIAGTWTWYTGEVPAKATKMYRLYNPNTGEHFYTSNVGERDHTIAAGWTDEGVGWIAPDKSNTPVYRLYNENLGGEHHYTTDANERKVLIAAGWKDEGIGWYSDDDKGTPVYREYNPNQLACNHNFTTDTNEHKTLVALGWKDEGIAWYGMKVLQ